MRLKKTTMCLVMLLLVLPSSGCFFKWAHTTPLMPVIEKPRRPNLEKMTGAQLKGLDPAVKQQLIKRDAQLKDAIERYEDVVDRYNAYAHKQNEKHGYGGRTLVEQKK